MKKTVLTACLLSLSLFAGHSFAADAACEAKAAEKKLAGAAKTSFVKKCTADSSPNAACEKSAADKKLAGAAKTSHIKKCMADADATKK